FHAGRAGLHAEAHLRRGSGLGTRNGGRRAMSGACQSGGRFPISRIQLVALSTLLTLLLALAGCGPKDPAWARMQETGVLRVGSDAGCPPREPLDERWQVVGFDVDMARGVGRRVGLEVPFVHLAYDGLYHALVTGQVDVLISALVPGYD